ncbi:MAG: VWA domain-containing protein, partial [Candidatus Nanopelagicales bacterium]
MPAATTPLLQAVPAAVISLVGRLRRAGLAVSTSEALDAASAVAAVGFGSRSGLRCALKATLVKDSTHDVVFERSFDATFPRAARPRAEAGQGPRAGSDDEMLEDLAAALRDGDAEQVDALLEEAIDRHGGSQDDGRSAGHHAQRALRRMNIPNLYRRYLDQAEGESGFNRALDAAEAAAAMEQMKRRMQDLVSGRMREADAGASMQQLEDPEDRLLLRAGADELVAMRQAMRPLARRLATRLGNRRRRGTSGLDMRRTIRSSMGTGGVPVQPVLRRRRPTKPDLIVLCDVSGSTAQFAPFTLTLL